MPGGKRCSGNTWNANACSARWRATGTAARDRPDRARLRIGYLSPDLRYHAVAQFVEPLLRHHDREQFEIFCYYLRARRRRCTWILEAPVAAAASNPSRGSATSPLLRARSYHAPRREHRDFGLEVDMRSIQRAPCLRAQSARAAALLDVASCRPRARRARASRAKRSRRRLRGARSARDLASRASDIHRHCNHGHVDLRRRRLLTSVPTRPPSTPARGHRFHCTDLRSGMPRTATRL